MSHSSKDIEFIILLTEFLYGLGVEKEKVFCSSVEGQGIMHGSRIEDGVRKALDDSAIIIYVMTRNFLESQACMQELGVGWYNNITKNCFYFLLNDLSMEEIKGFIGSTYKFTFMNKESLSEFIDDFLSVSQLPNKKATEIINLIAKLVDSTKSFIGKIVEEKKMTEDEIQDKVLNKLHESTKKLNVGEKKALASIYFSEDQCDLFELNTGVINLLQDKKYVYRVSSVSSFGMAFSFTLQPWFRDFVDENEEFRLELEKFKPEDIRRYTISV